MRSAAPSFWLLLLLVWCSPLFADPPETAEKANTATTSVNDPTDQLLQSLGARAVTPAEKASVNSHQGDLEAAMTVPGLLATGIVKNEREAILLRTGMAYSDFGKLGGFKEWLTKKNDFSIHPDGMVNPGKELYAVLQGTDGDIWKDPEIAGRKAFYEPLMKMMAGPVINPKISHDEILKLTGATITLPNGYTVPKFPMIIGYMHEWQGVVQSYLDADEAIRHGRGPLAGTVRHLGDYHTVLDSIYGHNGSGPSREEYTSWFKKKYNREPQKTEVPFWTEAHNIVKTNAKTAGVPNLFDNSLQSEKYAGSVKPNKLSMFHRIMDRIDGTINPEKIYEELAFMGPRYAMVESYFGGNYHGPIQTQLFTVEFEIDKMVEAKLITRAEAEILKNHAENQIALGKMAFAERAKRTRFYNGDKLIPAEEVGSRMTEVTHIELDSPSGPHRYAFVQVPDPQGGVPAEKIADAQGNIVDFMKIYKETIGRPTTEIVKRDPNWAIGGDYCGLGGL